VGDTIAQAGNDSPWIEEEFYQRTSKTDVLFVVDNSGSMEEEQNALIFNFWEFLQFLTDSQMDYHVGITVLDDYQGQPAIGQLYGPWRYIDSTNPDPVGAFADNMTVGSEGQGDCEVGLEAAHRAVTAPLVDEYNTGFYREEASLIVVVVSDEGDGSYDDSECDDADEYIGTQEFIAWLTTFKEGYGSQRRFHFSAIVGENDGCASSWGEAEAGDGYLDVVDALGSDATFHSICEQDWSAVMTELGRRAAGYRTVFSLSSYADASTLEVHLDPDGPGGSQVAIQIYEDPTFERQYSYEWVVPLNALRFSDETVPPHGSSLMVRYLPKS